MNKPIWITACVITLMITAFGWAQTGGQPGSVEDEIPKAALLTERGQQLAERLRMLRHNEKNLGAKHPVLPELQLQIEEVKVQLEAWSPAPNPFRVGGGDIPMRDIPQMNDEDLRQLVIRLADDIRLLEQRLERVEKRTR